jgi:hypothetical protein
MRSLYSSYLSMYKKMHQSQEGALAIMLVIVVLTTMLTAALTITSIRTERLRFTQSTQGSIRAETAVRKQADEILREIKLNNETIDTYYHSTAPLGSQANCTLNVWSTGTGGAFEYCLIYHGIIDNDYSSVPLKRAHYEVRTRISGIDVVGRTDMYLDAPYITETIFPLAENPEGISANDRFGSDVDIYREWVVVGAPGNGDGKAFVYHYDTTAKIWSYFTLNPSETIGEGTQGFGTSVAIYGDFIIVGAPFNFDNSPSADVLGAVDVFWKVPNFDNIWTHVAQLQNASLDPDDEFGRSVAINGDLIAIGAPNQATSGVNGGDVYMYRIVTPSPIDINFMDKLSASVTEPTLPGDQFGWDVALSGNNLVIGAPMGDGGFVDEGHAYSFKCPSCNPGGGAWIEYSDIPAPVGAVSGDRFGESVGVYEVNAVIGSPGSNSGASDAGAVYVYRDLGVNWHNLVSTSYGATTQASSFYGSSVAIDTHTLIGGKPGLLRGSVNIHDKDTVYEEDAWLPYPHIIPSTSTDNDEFGASVSLSEHKAVIGAPGDNTIGSDAGAIYVYDR